MAIEKHSSNFRIPKEWKELSSHDKFKKFSGPMPDKVHDRLIARIIGLSIITFGGYYLYLCCTATGKELLKNLRERTLIHIVKIKPVEDQDQKMDKTTFKTHKKSDATYPKISQNKPIHKPKTDHLLIEKLSDKLLVRIKDGREIINKYVEKLNEEALSEDNSPDQELQVSVNRDKELQVSFVEKSEAENFEGTDEWLMRKLEHIFLGKDKPIEYISVSKVREKYFKDLPKDQNGCLSEFEKTLIDKLHSGKILSLCLESEKENFLKELTSLQEVVIGLFKEALKENLTDKGSYEDEKVRISLWHKMTAVIRQPSNHLSEHLRKNNLLSMHIPFIVEVLSSEK